MVLSVFKNKRSKTAKEQAKKMYVKDIAYSNMFFLIPQELVRLFPYHVDSLLQLSDVSRMSEDTAMAVELIGKNYDGFQEVYNVIMYSLV